MHTIDTYHQSPPITPTQSHAFALRHQGESMMNSHDRRSIPDGAILIVDPDTSANSGDIVVAKLHNDSSTVKRYVVDGEHRYLLPLNPDYKPILMTPEMDIIGVVVSREISLR